MRLSVIQVVLITILSELFCSCINDSYNGTSGDREKTVIRLSLSSDAMQTRSNLAIIGGSGTSDIGECAIHNVCVGIFNSSGGTITIHEYTYKSGDAEEITTTTDGIEMVIVANVPSSLLKGKETKKDFLDVVQELEYTTSVDGLSKSKVTTVNSQEQTSLPMYADVTNLSLSGMGVASKAVTLTRVVARITLSSLKVNFGNTARLADATFVPKEIFMYQAHDRYAWNGTASSSMAVLSGESTVGTASTGLTESTTSATNYLSSGKLVFTGSAGTKEYLSATDNPYYFYVFPSSNTSPTKLIIKGIFYPKGKTESEGEVMYYPITVNHSQRGTTISVSGGSTYSDGDIYPKESMVEANTVYSLDVTINGRGVSKVTDELIPSSASITLNVDNWSTASSSIDFKYPPLSIGNFLYSDGSYGEYDPNKPAKAIAVIFSTTTSTTDQTHGWTHGYAMALTNASTSTFWATFADSIDTAIPNTSGVESIKNNKDGYTESNLFENKVSPGAIYSALTYSVQYPDGTSGWYLPSSGQFYDICTKLGKVSVPTSSYYNMLHWQKGDFGMKNDTTNYATLCRANINKYLKMLEINGYTVDKLGTSSEKFWSSSEINKSGSFILSFSLSSMNIQTISKTSYCKVRPVIAF